MDLNGQPVYKSYACVQTTWTMNFFYL